MAGVDEFMRVALPYTWAILLLVGIALLLIGVAFGFFKLVAYVLELTREWGRQLLLGIGVWYLFTVTMEIAAVAKPLVSRSAAAFSSGVQLLLPAPEASKTDVKATTLDTNPFAFLDGLFNATATPH